MSIPWRLLIEEFPQDAALNLALDEAIAEHVGNAGAPATIRLWRNANVLVLGRFEHRLPRFDAAVKRITAQGIEVLQRRSGGGAVFHDLGDVNFLIAVPRAAGLAHLGIHQAYEVLCQGVAKGLHLLGAPCTFGRVEGAFCDGSHNLVVDGKKIAGTAQARRKGFIMVHGTLLINSDVERLTRIIRSFYEAAGADGAVNAAAVTTLARQLNRPVSFDEVCAALTRGFRSLGNGARGTLLDSELHRAEQLKETVAANGAQSLVA